jgi:uncharacterized protein YerC
MKSSKVCHKPVPQTPPTSVPRTNLTYTRGATFWFRRRIPTDLVRAKAYGEVIEIRESLGTSDKREAERLAHYRALELLDEWERKRKELRAQGASGFVRRSNGVAATRPLSSLTPLERRAFIHGIFIRLEKAALNGGLRDPDALQDSVKAEWIENTKVDLAVMRGHSNYAPLDWDEKLAKALEAQEIKVDKKAEPVLPELRNLFTRAHVESANRTLDSLICKLQPREESYFRDLGIGSEVQELPKFVSLEKLGCAYKKHQKEIGSSLATLAKIQPCLNIMTDLWGAHSPVSSIGREHATQLIQFIRKLPKNGTKNYPAHFTLQKMSELEEQKESPEWISAKTQRNHFGSISAILNFAVDEGWLDANPLSNRNLIRRLPEVETESKPMMTPDEIGLIINNEKFRSERTNGDRGPARFWVPLLCLFHDAVRTWIDTADLPRVAPAANRHIEVKLICGLGFIRRLDEIGSVGPPPEWTLQRSLRWVLFDIHADTVQVALDRLRLDLLGVDE